MVVASRHNGSGLRVELMIGANIMMGLQPSHQPTSPPWPTSHQSHHSRPSSGHRIPTMEQSHSGCLLPEPWQPQQADCLRVHFASNELRMSIDGNFTLSGWLVLVGRWNKTKKNEKMKLYFLQQTQ